jgi:uncharacterized protein YeaO (DUF488 family)
MKKEKAKIHLWLKEIAPSGKSRKWVGRKNLKGGKNARKI